VKASNDDCPCPELIKRTSASRAASQSSRMRRWTGHRQKSGSVAAARRAAGALRKRSPALHPMAPHAWFSMSSAELVRPLSCGVCVENIQPDGVGKVRSCPGFLLPPDGRLPPCSVADGVA